MDQRGANQLESQMNEVRPVWLLEGESGKSTRDTGTMSRVVIVGCASRCIHIRVEVKVAEVAY